MIINCGPNQKTLIDKEPFIAPFISTASSLFLSTIAATIIERTENTIPIPILWRMLIPLSFPVSFLRVGTRTLSYRITADIIPIAARVKIEAGGTSNPLPNFLFMMAPCLMKKVEVCAAQIPNGKVNTQMGIMLMISFSSSTLVTVASLQGLCFSSMFPSFSVIAALSRNLSFLV
ncbi:hypothetical protein V8G54_009282 [Vigna mungo]|uniref:Uncharacterized protein n=1 Tax=Vigna mungo TaxID=3915 RepID=A0AAQ3NVU4_VIGMU